MAQTIVTVKLNGQSYQMQCGEDEVEQIEQLASEIDGLMQQLKPQGGHVPDVRLLAIISIMMAERAQEAEKALAHAKAEMSEMQQNAEANTDAMPADSENNTPQVDVTALSSQIEQAALRINAITAKLAQ